MMSEWNYYKANDELVRGKGTHKCASEMKQLHSSISQVTGQLKT